MPMNSWRFASDRKVEIDAAAGAPSDLQGGLESIKIESNRKSVANQPKLQFRRSSALKYVVANSVYVSSMAKRIGPLLVFSLLATFGLAQNQAPQIGYKSAADAEQKKTLLLKDFKPVSMLHVPVHPIDRAKFYVIDVHNHVNDAARIDEHMPPVRVVEVMD